MLENVPGNDCLDELVLPYCYINFVYMFIHYLLLNIVSHFLTAFNTLHQTLSNYAFSFTMHKCTSQPHKFPLKH